MGRQQLLHMQPAIQKLTADPPLPIQPRQSPTMTMQAVPIRSRGTSTSRSSSLRSPSRQLT